MSIRTSARFGIVVFLEGNPRDHTVCSTETSPCKSAASWRPPCPSRTPQSRRLSTGGCSGSPPARNGEADRAERGGAERPAALQERGHRGAGGTPGGHHPAARGVRAEPPGVLDHGGRSRTLASAARGGGRH